MTLKFKVNTHGLNIEGLEGINPELRGPCKAKEGKKHKCPEDEQDSDEEKRMKDLEHQVAQLYRLVGDLTRSIQYYHRS